MADTINQRIFYYRKLAGLTQAEAAERMNLKLSTYSQMERKGKITTEKLLKIADILNIEPDILLNGQKTNYVFPSSSKTINEDNYLTISQPPLTLKSDDFIPSNRELSAMKIVHNLPKSEQEKVYNFIQELFNKNK